MKILGIVQKAERDPQDFIFGDSCKRQKVIPKDIMEKVWSNLTVKEYLMRTSIEGRRRTHVDGQPCCVGSDCHLVPHLGCELVMDIMLTL